VRELVCLQMASGRSIRLTSEHRLLGATGWTRLRDVHPGDRLALARKLSEPEAAADVADEHLVLLGHLIGDGSYSSREPIRYTTVSAANLRAVVDAARRIGCLPRVTDRSGRTGWEVSLGANANRWRSRR
jgi:replicative DNA helicase